MVASDMPAAWAADAPPILNECVLRFASGRHCCIILEKEDLVKYDPSWNWNNGPLRADSVVYILRL